MKKDRKKWPLLLCLVLLAWGSLTALAWAGGYPRREAYRESYDPLREPVFTLLLRGIHAGDLPWHTEEAEEEKDFHISPPDAALAEIFPVETEEETESAPAENVTAESPGAAEFTGVGTFSEVGLDWFSDALFIGDSRTEGLALYSELRDCAEFASKTSLSMSNLFSWKLNHRSPGGTVREQGLEEILSEKQYGKVYFCMGVNELGGNAESFVENCRQAVEAIQRSQPEALIFVQGMMGVTAERSRRGDAVNNENIQARNLMLSTLADGEKVFYLDLNEALCDQDGNLPASLTNDGVHLKAVEYRRWVEFLRENGITNGSGT